MANKLPSAANGGEIPLSPMDKFSGRGYFTKNTLLFSLFLIIGHLVFGQYHYLPRSIQMRDGKYLAADLYTIDTTAARSVILIQTPYNKFWYRFNIGNPDWQIPYDSMRYNYLIVDWRGFYGSAGAESLGYDRGLDGYDLIEYIATQPWSNGRIGTWGASALGVIQFMTARHHPPHLVCCVPMVSSYQTAYTDYFSGGDYLKELTQGKAALGFVPESLILAHYRHDLYWRLIEMYTSYPAAINVPMLLITGWFDHNLDSPLKAYYALRDSSEPTVRDKHKIIIGPWTHGGLGRLEQGELIFPGAVDSVRGPSLRIFDHYLYNINNGYENEPRVRFFEPGTDTWKAVDDWYAYGNRTDTFYLQPNGLLSKDAPNMPNPPDSLFFDPRAPAPSIGGIRFSPFNPNVIVGPRDQRDSVEARADVLLYTTPILTQPLTIAGPTAVKLYASSDCEDTDFSVRLTDVYPDGRSMLVMEGIRRGRFRNTYEQEEPLVPGVTYEINLDLRNIAYTFPAGHHLRLIISSSDYPIFDINLNNGDSLYQPGDTVIARNKIYHEPGALSQVIFKTRATGLITEGERSIRLKPGRTADIVHGQARWKITFDHETDIELMIYDVGGRKIRTLMSRRMIAGSHEIAIDLNGLPDGVYYARLVEDGRIAHIMKIINVRFTGRY